MKQVSQNRFPETDTVVNVHNSGGNPPASIQSLEEVLIKLPDAILHVIDEKQSIELASGELMIVRLRQGDNIVAVFVRVGDEFQWPLVKDEAAVKLSGSHYLFSLHVPEGVNLVKYGLTIKGEGQEKLVEELDAILEHYSGFLVKEVKGEVNWVEVAKELLPVDAMDLNSGGYATALAPNVDDYSGSIARMIAASSGQVIKGIMWCGDFTIGVMKLGDEFFRKRMGPRSDTGIIPETLRRMKSIVIGVKKLTKMSEDVATGLLSGVEKVSGFFTSSMGNSKVGKMFVKLVPAEIVLASLDGFNKVFDAVEVTGRNVMSTTSVVTTGLVTDRYGDEAARVASEGLGAAEHAFGTAWALFKISKAFSPKSIMNPTTLAKAAAQANSGSLQGKHKKP